MSPSNTLFAPAEKATANEITRQVQAVRATELFREILFVTPDILLVLNRQRQVVFANRAALDMAKADKQELISGLRPGDVWKCRHADCEKGCGTTESCQACGAVATILKSQQGEKSSQECRITRQNGVALDLRVTTHRLTIDEEPYVVLIAKDIGHEKRRRALERIFFHDINNTALGFQALDYFLNHACCDPEQVNKLRELSGQLYRELNEELKSQQDLTAAENGDLIVHKGPIQSGLLLEDIVGNYRQRSVAIKRFIVIHNTSVNITFESDKTLLRRVLGNLVKNALEASQRGQTVTVCAKEVNDSIQFSVHNTNPMPRHIQLQIFNRSFSTKEEGRGLGTYSIRLLTEAYLGGSVSFESSPEHGTIFTVTYPLTTES